MTIDLDELMTGYQKSHRDGTRMPGLAYYLEKIIAQNDEIIELLKTIQMEI